MADPVAVDTGGFTMTNYTGAKQLREQIRHLERRLGALNDHDMNCCGVTMSQCHAIVEIGRAGTLTLSELAEILGLDNSTTSRTVNNLVTRGLSDRLPDSEDRRRIAISLTERGTEIFRGIESRMDARFSAIYAALPEDRKNHVLEALDLLLETLGHQNCC